MSCQAAGTYPVVPNKTLAGLANAGRVCITHAFDSNWIFADEFESGGTAYGED